MNDSNRKIACRGMLRGLQATSAAATLLLAACATIVPDDFPAPGVQPSRGPLPQSVMSSIDAHSQWLNSTSSFQENRELNSQRSTVRLKGFSSIDAVDRSAVISVNAAMSGYFREIEAKLYRSKKAEPDVCLALSGGGMRAAAFGIGVLQGLRDTDKFKDIDVISAVSGGAYALGWFVQERTKGKSEAETLDDNFIDNQIKPESFSLPLIAASVIASPIDIFTTGSVFNNGIDSSSLSTAYGVMLTTVFGGYSSDLKMKRIRKSVEKGLIPLPIFGLAAFPLPENWKKFPDATRSVSSLAKSVALNDTYMEVTPYRYGTQGIGFQDRWPTPLPDNLWAYVALSGAAYDRPHDRKSLSRLSGLVRLGGTLSMVVNKRYPIAVSESTAETLSRQYLYATDGGFSENLAAFPLALRRCNTIVIADSEFDPEWIMEGYTILKRRLAQEHNLIFQVPGIDDILAANKSKVKYFERSDGVNVPVSDRQCTREPDEMDCAARKATTTVFEGTLTKIPLALGDNDTTRILYLKLGMADEKNDSPLMSEVLSYFTECIKTPTQCHFPQDLTFDRKNPAKSQKYTERQFRAYRQLARHIVRTINWNSAGAKPPESFSPEMSIGLVPHPR
jgi:hypothetical protein